MLHQYDPAGLRADLRLQVRKQPRWLRSVLPIHVFRISSLAAFTLLFFISVSPAAAQKITRGPYLQWATKGSIWVVWDQDVATAAEVHYGPTAAMSLTQKSKISSTHHEVELSGLQAGATYHYAIYSGGAKRSADLTLPAPVAKGAPFRFLAFGDTRSDHAAHQKLIYSMALEPGVRFYVNTGDLVASGDQQTQWNTFFTVEKPMASLKPLFPVIGNHDEEDGDATLFYNHFVTNPGIGVPEAYYSWDYGNSHFIVLDGFVYVDKWYVCALAGKLYDCFKPAQLNWLKQDLQAASADPAIEHIFIFIHEGPYSSKPGRSGSEQMRALLPLFKASGVSLIISGHDHYYERGVSGNNIPYMITGGGGAPLYATGAPSPAPHTVAVNAVKYHYAVIDVQGPQIKVLVKTPDGKQLDQYTLGSPPPPPPPTDAGLPAVDASPLVDASPQPADGTAVDAATTAPDVSTKAPDTGGASAAGDDDAGCGCRVSSDARGASALVLVMALILFVLGRRREC
jgi:MYXO-CTERM domain-containing protein